MTLEELAAVLQGTGLPVTYHAWPEDEDVPALPLICYLATGKNPTFADGQVYYTYEDIRVELYVKSPDPALEAMVEAALAGFHWKQGEKSYIASERCWLIPYEIEV
ncbi:MAG: hypothetical protein IJA75_03095 [Oscillospiraceae bacterium]|nr:hypothetical protein [Oscillospiraceae bacterium]